MQSGDLLAARFRLGPHLERSRRGELFLARDEQTGASCEVEWLRASGFEGEEMTRLVEREVAIGERLASVPGLVRALAWGAGDSLSLWIAREVVDGAFPFDPGRGALARRAAAVLGAARSVGRLEAEGVVHRDLGPISLLRAPDGGLRLAGLALARVEGLPEPSPGPMGLPLACLPCAAPEVLETPWRADVRADVFALGALLFRGLSGSWPFPGPSLVQVVRQHDRVRAGDAPAPRPSALVPEVAPALDRICADALSLDPGRRPRSPSALAEALAAWLAPLGPLPPETDDDADAGVGVAREQIEVTWRPPTGRFQRPSAITPIATVAASSPALPPLPPPLPPLPAPPPLPALPPPAPPVPPPEPLTPEAAGLTIVRGDEGSSDGASLVARVDPKRMEELVANLRRVEPGQATALLLDLQDVEHLGGAQLEALTEVLTLAERRGLLAAMFGLRRALRQFLVIMRLEQVLPRTLDAQDPLAADAELRRLAIPRAT